MDDGINMNCPECDCFLHGPSKSTKEDVQQLKYIAHAWRDKRKAERKSFRNDYYAVTGYVKELEMLLLQNGIPLPSTKEDIDELPTRLEGSD